MRILSNQSKTTMQRKQNTKERKREKKTVVSVFGYKWASKCVEFINCYRQKPTNGKQERLKKHTTNREQSIRAKETS